MPFKTCPECQKKHGPRTLACTCGHAFTKKAGVLTAVPPAAVIEHTLPAPEPGPEVENRPRDLPPGGSRLFTGDLTPVPPPSPSPVITKRPEPPAKKLQIEVAPASETSDPFPPDRSGAEALKNAITLAEGLMATDFDKMELFKLAAKARRLADRLEELSRRYEYIDPREAPVHEPA